LVEEFVVQFWLLDLAEQFTLLLLNLLASLQDEQLQVLVLLDLTRKVQLLKQTQHVEIIYPYQVPKTMEWTAGIGEICHFNYLPYKAGNPKRQVMI
jgi:hypothetical protein